MSEKDKQLINKAWSTSSIDWYSINELIEQAESNECKESLKTIKHRKYHQEEYHCGLDSW